MIHKVNDLLEFNEWLSVSGRAFMDMHGRDGSTVTVYHRGHFINLKRETNGQLRTWLVTSSGRLPRFGSESVNHYHVSPEQLKGLENVKVTTQGRKAVIIGEIKRLQAELAHLNRFPDDNFENGTVLQVVKTYKRALPKPRSTEELWNFDPNAPTFDEVEYTYVLLKANDAWWCTGTNGHQINGVSWEKVIEFVGDDELIDVRTGRSIMTDAVHEEVNGDAADGAGEAPKSVDVGA